MSENRLSELRHRWDRERTPHLTLELAETYRREGFLNEAAECLEAQLQDRPDHVATRVALGRCRLEAGRSREAIESLKTIVDRDPSHLVANKLLVRAYVDVGQAQDATDRLELYRLLNDGDPDIEGLESMIASVASQPLPEPPPSSMSSNGHGEPFAGLWDDLDPDDWEPLLADGLFFVESGRQALEPLIEDLPEEVESDTSAESPEGDVASVRLAELYREQGHLDEARAQYESVLRRNPGDEGAQRGLRALDESAGPSPRERKLAALNELLGRVRQARDTES